MTRHHDGPPLWKVSLPPVPTGAIVALTVGAIAFACIPRGDSTEEALLRAGVPPEAVGNLPDSAADLPSPPPVQRPKEKPPGADAVAVRRLALDGAPLPKQRAALRKFLRARGVSEAGVASTFAHMVNGITLESGAPKGARTRIGGKGLVPAGSSWPENRHGTPLQLVAMLDLAELPRVGDLPRAGRLALYYNGDFDHFTMDPLETGRVLYLPPGTRATELAPPEEDFAVAAKPRRGIAVPIAGESGNAVESLPKAQQKPLYDAMNELSDTGIYRESHVLGASLDVQGPALEELEYALGPKSDYMSEANRARFTPAERSRDQWVLLAQIEEENDMIFADGGVLYYAILRDDLKRRRFDRVAVVMQSH